MIRPEVLALLKRWSEVLIGLAIAAAGAWTMRSPDYFWFAIGAIACAGGLGLAWGAWRRMRLTSMDADGVGVVEVDERQVSYFGPYEGGAVSINDLARVTIVTTDKGPAVEDCHWLLEEDGGSRLMIPNSAEGAGKLFDALAPLSGVNFDLALRAMGSTANASFVIWSKDRNRLH